MSDPTNFETRLAAALQRRADEAPTTVDASAVTRAAARAGSSVGGRLFGVPAWRTARLALAVALLVLLVAASLIIGSQLVSPRPKLDLGRLLPAGQMTTARGGQTATLLRDGRVLLVGGQAEDASTAELYDPATNAFTRTGPISTLWRNSAAAAVLPDGRVLVVGGFGQTPDSEDVVPFPFGELYDPATGTFSRTGMMIEPRQYLWAGLTLPDGRVLIAGGQGAGGTIDTVEFFDPATDSFVSGGSLQVPRTQHTLTLLGDGRVLITGGWGTDGPVATAEIYDPDTGTSVPTADLGVPRSGHMASMLADGRVLIVGGTGPGGSYGEALVSAELYDPTTGTFAPTGSLTTGRSGASSVNLRDGRVLVAGGYNVDGDPRTIESYDPASGRFDVVGTLAPAQSSMNSNWLTATLLADGSVLLVGRDSTMAERYDPSLPAAPAQPGPNAITPVGFVTIDGPGALRTGHTATRLLDGRVLIAGGSEGGTGAVLASAEIFDPATGLLSETGSMDSARTGHAAALLPDGRVLIAGGRDAQDAPAASRTAELFDPVTGTFSATGDMTVARAQGNLGSLGGRSATALSLHDGRVLIVGGDPVPDSFDGSSLVPWSAEIYDPTSGQFGSIMTRKEPLPGVQSASLLPNGHVLLIVRHGREAAQTEIYDPVTDTWGPPRPMAGGRIYFSATALADGRVLIVGGRPTGRDGPLVDAQTWDPIDGSFSRAGEQTDARSNHAATLLPDGTVLITGGRGTSAVGGGSGPPQDLTSAELWDPVSRTFSPAGTMAAVRNNHTATLLDDGRVLLVGGVTRQPDRNVPDPWAAELYIGQ